jgi:hypothetical protein
MYHAYKYFSLYIRIKIALSAEASERHITSKVAKKYQRNENDHKTTQEAQN